MRIAVYAGSFDPITNGHLDIISRAEQLFDQLIIVVAQNSGKKNLFTLDERVDLIRGVVIPETKTHWRKGQEPTRILALPEGKLLVEFANDLRACAMIRGLRPVQDFPGEFSLASINRRIRPNIETIMLITDPSVSEVSSSMVKELAALNGPFEQFVPPNVAKALQDKIRP